jgi:hypothetical protein
MAQTSPASSTFQQKDEGQTLRLLRTTLKNPRALLVSLGLYLETVSRDAFKSQSWGKNKWLDRRQTRMVPNWPGVIADFRAQKRAPKPQRFQASPVLIDRGDLLKSVKSRVLDAKTVEIGSNLPHSGALNDGGVTWTEMITKDVRRRLYVWMLGLKAKHQKAQAALPRSQKKEQRKAIAAHPDVVAAKAKQDAAKANAAPYKGTGQKAPQPVRAAVQAASKDMKAAKAKASQAAATVGPTTQAIEKAQKAADAWGQARSLGWLLNKKFKGRRLPVKHPARHFIGLHPKATKQVEDDLGIIIRGGKPAGKGGKAHP